MLVLISTRNAIPGCFKHYLFRIKYMGKYIQCHVRQDLTLSVKLVSKSFPVNQYKAHRLYNGRYTKNI